MLFVTMRNGCQVRITIQLTMMGKLNHRPFPEIQFDYKGKFGFGITSIRFASNCPLRTPHPLKKKFLSHSNLIYLKMHIVKEENWI
jgi:hypothetical protein